MVDVIRGSTESPESTELLISHLEEIEFELAVFYSGYPILTSSDKSSVDGILLSKNHGIIIFDIVEGGQETERKDVRDEMYNLIYSKLISNRSLSQVRGKLILPINVLSFAPTYSNFHTPEDSELINSKEKLFAFIESIYKESDGEEYRKVLEVIQSVSKLKQRGKRVIVNTNSKGDRINKLEKSVSKFWISSKVRQL